MNGDSLRSVSENVSYIRRSRPLNENDTHRSRPAPIAVQRCDRFVGRTLNWLYDHLRFVPRYQSFVICDSLENRGEFPEMTAIQYDRNSLARAIWRRISGTDAHPLAVRLLRQ